MSNQRVGVLEAVAAVFLSTFLLWMLFDGSAPHAGVTEVGKWFLPQPVEVKELARTDGAVFWFEGADWLVTRETFTYTLLVRVTLVEVNDSDSAFLRKVVFWSREFEPKIMFILGSKTLYISRTPFRMEDCWFIGEEKCHWDYSIIRSESRYVRNVFPQWQVSRWKWKDPEYVVFDWYDKTLEAVKYEEYAGLLRSR